MHPSTIQTQITRVRNNAVKEEADWLAVEEPLEIRLLSGPSADRRLQSVSVTMRTPGQDFDLATGFLFTEGIIQKAGAIKAIHHDDSAEGKIVHVELEEHVSVNIAKLERNFYTTSSCGVCGKASIDAVRTVRLVETAAVPFQITASTLLSLPDTLRRAQAVFDNTGGLHGCALFDAAGKLVLSREDVGRHNAVDKLIGAALHTGLFPLDPYLLMLSGRASFELVQKAWMAGIQAVAAVGAPSSLAVQLAAEADMTLAGFLRNGGFNIYSGQQRIVISGHEDSY